MQEQQAGWQVGQGHGKVEGSVQKMAKLGQAHQGRQNCHCRRVIETLINLVRIQLGRCWNLDVGLGQRMEDLACIVLSSGLYAGSQGAQDKLYRVQGGALAVRPS